MLSLLTLAVAPLAGGDHPPAPSWRPAGFHAVAYVNDPLSHGAVGDGLLSLNEAIRLHNGTLAYALLSPAEAQQISLIPGTGATTDVTWVDIDGTSTPVIAIQQDLDPILDTNLGMDIIGFNDPPVLDFTGPNLNHGVRSQSNSLFLRNLTLLGGPYGVDATQTDITATQGPQAGAVFENVTFQGQAIFAVRVVAQTVGGVGRLIFGGCRFVNVPTAVIHIEAVANRTTIFESFDVTMENVTDGYMVTLGDGGTARYTFDRQDLAVADSAIVVRHAPLANRTTLVEGTHVRLRAASGLTLAPSAGTLVQLALRMWDVVGSNSAVAMGGGRTFGVIEDSTFLGPASLRTDNPPAPLDVRNVQFGNGNLLLWSYGGQDLRLTEARCRNSQVLAMGPRPVVVRDCSFENSTVGSLTSAQVLCDGCYLPNPQASVSVTNPRPAPLLGSMGIQPESVAVGSTLNLVADLPPGLFGLFVLGFTDPYPQLLAPPLHVYTIPSLTFVLPGVYRLQQSFPWSIPNSLAFVGFDLTAQIAVLPDPGVQAPPIHFPPGRRFVLQ